MTILSFWDLPEDAQLAVLSFLSPADAAAFACTARRAASLCCSTSPLWLSMCDRRWAHLTAPRLWAPHTLPSRLLLSALQRCSPLPGFWRRIGQSSVGPGQSLVFFEWAPNSITASLVAPHPPGGVVKVPLLWMGISPESGNLVAFLDPDGGARCSSMDDEENKAGLVPVSVSFLGSNHIVVEERKMVWSNGGGEENEFNGERMMAEMYQYFANRTSPGAADRRQRRKQMGRVRWEPKHFLKIENYCPTPDRPLQGLWKGFSEDMKLDFYLVTYDESGGITCRQVGEGAEPFSSYSPVFWTSNTTFIEPPFSREERSIFESRQHMQPGDWNGDNFGMDAVSCILCINSSYDLVIPDLHGSSGDPRNVEGRIWVYKDKTFGFGFLRNNFIVDLKHVTKNGRLLDTVEYFRNVSSI